MPKASKDDEPMTLSELVAKVFTLGFDTAKEDTKDRYDDAVEALKDEEVVDKLAKLHEGFSDAMLEHMEAMLDVESLDEEDEEDDNETTR